MKITIALMVALYAAMAGAQDKKDCSHAYMCPGVPEITISTLTQAEQLEIAKADEAVQKARQNDEETRNKIIKAHGGYVLPPCSSRTLYSSCFVESGHRLSDEAEWKGQYLILTKKWMPEL